MTLKKSILFTFIALISVGLIVAARFVVQFIKIGSSYDAKITCSCLFVSGRDLESIKKEDLYSVPFANIQVDYNQKTVSSDIYGIGKATALFRPGLGCTLVNESTVEELQQQPSASLMDTFKSGTIIRSDVLMAIDTTALNITIQKAFTETNPQNIKRTRAVVILHQGKLVLEHYAPGITATTPLLGWSMTKSVTNAMIGLLVQDKKLDVYQPAPIVEWMNDDRKNITVDHLLRMSSGLDFEEDYSSPSDATTMLFRKKSTATYALQSKLVFTPGSKWYYSSGTTNILQEIIRRQFHTLAEYQAYPHQKLFDKIGMHSAVMEPDASGTYVGSSFMYATAMDWARFGQLSLQDGMWNGERILPIGWVSYSSTEAPHSDGQYGAQFWMDHKDKEFPQDAYYADGYEGQYIVVIPSKKLVLVRLGCTQGDGFDFKSFVKEISAAIH